MAGLPIANWIAGAAQGTLGIGQMIAGMRMKKPIIPEAEIPSEIFENMTDAEYWSHIGMPPEQRQRAIEDIQRGGATEMANITSLKGGLGATSRAAQRETDQYAGLRDFDVSKRFENINRLYGARERMAEEKTRVSDINRQIQLDKRARRDAMIGAGMQNFGQSFSTFVGGGGGQAPSGQPPPSSAGVQSSAGAYDFGSKWTATQMPTSTGFTPQTSLGSYLN